MFDLLVHRFITQEVSQTCVQAESLGGHGLEPCPGLGNYTAKLERPCKDQELGLREETICKAVSMLCDTAVVIPDTARLLSSMKSRTPTCKP